MTKMYIFLGPGDEIIAKESFELDLTANAYAQRLSRKWELTIRIFKQVGQPIVVKSDEK